MKSTFPFDCGTRFATLSLVVLGFILPLRAADTCETITAVPAGLVQIGSGSAIVGSDGESTVSGGQTVYVKVKNENLLGVSVSVEIARNVTPKVVVCTYRALLPPRTTGIYTGSFIGQAPLGWKITVGVGDESDAGVLTYQIYSESPSALLRSKVNKSKRKQAKGK